MRGEIIPNPYDDNIFRPMPDVQRDGDLLFVGRLVSDKGADMLLRALHLLASRGIYPSLMIAGDGPERRGLQMLAGELGLTDRVRFVGVLRGVDLARTMNAHRIVVVPSRWAEPFGIVALEAIACGCAVIGSGQGGLPEAIGPCGVTFPNGDLAALAAALRKLLSDATLVSRLREEASAHLRKHTARSVAAAYLELFQNVLE